MRVSCAGPALTEGLGGGPALDGPALDILRSTILKSPTMPHTMPHTCRSFKSQRDPSLPAFPACAHDPRLRRDVGAKHQALTEGLGEVSWVLVATVAMNKPGFVLCHARAWGPRTPSLPSKSFARSTASSIGDIRSPRVPLGDHGFQRRRSVGAGRERDRLVRFWPRLPVRGALGLGRPEPSVGVRELPCLPVVERHEHAACAARRMRASWPATLASTRVRRPSACACTDSLVVRAALQTESRHCAGADHRHRHAGGAARYRPQARSKGGFTRLAGCWPQLPHAHVQPTEHGMQARWCTCL